LHQADAGFSMDTKGTVADGHCEKACKHSETA